MTTPTLPQFKQWARDCQPAAKAVLMARVYAQMERERVAAYIQPIFDSYRFTVDPKWELPESEQAITDPERLYLCGDEVLCKLYYQDCDDAHRAHGFTGPVGHCPALVSEHLRRVTERALMDLARPLFDLDPDHLYGDARAKYLELLIGACFAKDAGREGAHVA